MLNILLIEDDEDDAFMIGLALPARRTEWQNLLGAERPTGPSTTSKAPGSIPTATRPPFPNLIFTDLKMPGMDGFEILRWLKTDTALQVIPTTVLSSSTQNEDIEMAYRLGANAYMRKPHSLADLQEQVRSAFDFWTRCVKAHLARN